MKKVISVVLSLVMVFGFVLPVFAEEVTDKSCDCGFNPVIYVAALGSGTVYENYGTDEEKALFRPETGPLVAEAVSVILPALPALLAGDYDTFGDALIGFVNSAFGGLALDGDGNSKEGVYAPEEYPETGDHGIEHSFYFGYDFRLDPYTHADRLHKTIQLMKELTGHDKVQLKASSMGGVVTMAYLERYGTDDIETVIFQNCPIQGTAVAGELFCRKFEINKDALVNYALDAIPALEQDFFQGFLYGLATALDDLGVWSTLLTLVDPIVENLLDRVYDEALIPIFGTLPGIWSFVPDEYYEEAKTVMVNEETQAGLIEKLDNYHYNVQAKAPEILREANKTAKIYIVAGYDIQRTPLVSAYMNTSDGTVDTKYASVGAVTADIRSTFPQGYSQAVNDGHNHISPDFCIDASTCALPEQTWFIKDMLHCTTHEGHDKFYEKMLTGDEQFYIDTYEEYPQFMQNNIPDQTFNKVENLSATELFKKQPNFTNFVMMLRSFINVIKSFFAGLFVK
ncbi:MAG: hypothetical protein J6A97_03875 [Clostridia bacterium]|nr:hypothetical protein [Clostridia bacterium]